ncbi:MAG: hypothetical protein ACRDY5_09700 [Acidimicrobiales bacterium]
MILVGHSDLGGQGLNGRVALVGSTAVVAAGYVPLSTMSFANHKTVAHNTSPPCPTIPVKVVDLSDPTRPSVAATIAGAAGPSGREVDALAVATPGFTGDLVAIAFASGPLDLETFRSRGVVRPAAPPTAASSTTTSPAGGTPGCSGATSPTPTMSTRPPRPVARRPPAATSAAPRTSSRSSSSAYATGASCRCPAAPTARAQHQEHRRTDRRCHRSGPPHPDRHLAAPRPGPQP